MNSAEPAIVPVGCYDASGADKVAILAVGWVLDSPLDASKVERAWRKLCGVWSILSSRLRTNSKTKAWEYHIPSDGASTCSFRHLKMNGPIAAHYRYSTPAPNIRCTVKENPHNLFSDPARRSVAYLMRSDVPISALQVTSFDDGSLIGLSIPHVTADGHGYKEIMRALACVLDGKNVPPLELCDPFLPFMGARDAPETSGWRTYNAIQVAVLAACFLWHIVRHPKSQYRDVYFPPHAVQKIKQEAMDDIHKLQPRGEEQQKLWVSTSDVLFAYCLKRVYPPSCSRTPLSVVYMTNMRHYVPALFPTPYIHNAARGVVLPPITLAAVHDMSLGELALLMRSTLQYELSPARAEEYIRWRLADANRGRLHWFMEPHGRWSVVSNWRDMDMMEIDFSSAAAEVGKKVGSVYLWLHMYLPVAGPRNSWYLINDNAGGGVWMTGNMDKDVWKRRDGFGEFLK